MHELLEHLFHNKKLIVDMNIELKKLLLTDFRYAKEAYEADSIEAENALKSKDMVSYYDYSLNLTLADTSWALGKLDEAKTFYQHNSKILLQKRAWHTEHSHSNYPIDAILDWEASTFIKSGNLETGKTYLKRAINYWNNRSGNYLVLTKLGLHAAQAGLEEEAQYANTVIKARLELSGSNSIIAQEVRKMLHYEPAQIQLLLGNWNLFNQEIEKFKRVEQLIKENKGLIAFPDALQKALIAAMKGLTLIALMHNNSIEIDTIKHTSIQAFEEAMLYFYEFNGQIDWNIYFMQLNKIIVNQLITSRKINPNPFADTY